VRVVDEVVAAGGHRLNEDRLGHHGDVAWAIDGATSLEESAFLPAATDVQWLVDTLGRRLTALPSASAFPDAAALIEYVAARIAQEIADLGFPADRVHPTCSLGLLIDRGAEVELARVGDATCVAVGDGGVVQVSTDYFSHREAAAVADAGGDGLDHSDVRARMLVRRDGYIRGTGPESVFSGHPARGIREHGATTAWRGIEHVLLCTDGFARAVVDYALYPDWRSLVAAAAKRGLAAVAEEIREFEHDIEERLKSRGSDAVATGHFKTRDDVAAVLVVA
jgi:serine/threonine protein phosphatase PrpC